MENVYHPESVFASKRSWVNARGCEQGRRRGGVIYVYTCHCLVIIPSKPPRHLVTQGTFKSREPRRRRRAHDEAARSRGNCFSHTRQSNDVVLSSLNVFSPIGAWMWMCWYVRNTSSCIAQCDRTNWTRSIASTFSMPPPRHLYRYVFSLALNYWTFRSITPWPVFEGISLFFILIRTRIHVAGSVTSQRIIMQLCAWQRARSRVYWSRTMYARDR